MTATTRSERSDAPGSEAIAKQAEPIMNSTPIRRASPFAAPAVSTAADAALNARIAAVHAEAYAPSAPGKPRRSARR